jgi:hypothetical protein
VAKLIVTVRDLTSFLYKGGPVALAFATVKYQISHLWTVKSTVTD